MTHEIAMATLLAKMEAAAKEVQRLCNELAAKREELAGLEEDYRREIAIEVEESRLLGSLTVEGRRQAYEKMASLIRARSAGQIARMEIERFGKPVV